METFSQRQVNMVFDRVPARTLREWGLQGLYQWADEIENGRGVHRVFHRLHLYQMALVERLAKANYSLKDIKEIVKVTFDEKITRFNGYLIVSEPGGKGIAAGFLSKEEMMTDEFFSLFKERSMFVIINLATLKNNVDRLTLEKLK